MEIVAILIVLVVILFAIVGVIINVLYFVFVEEHFDIAIIVLVIVSFLILANRH